MVESIIKGLKGVAELQGPLQASIWDQGDAVGAWIGDKLVAVVFPTPETLPQVHHTLFLVASANMPNSGFLSFLFLAALHVPSSHPTSLMGCVAARLQKLLAWTPSMAS